MERICKKHGITEYSQGSRPRCRKCAVLAVTKRRRKVKEMAIEYKGGGCSLCGYNKSKVALDFHHLDPSKKGFGLSAKGYSRSWKEVKEELDKCILVCANCHREMEHSSL